MQTRRRRDSHILRIITPDGFQPRLQSLDQRFSRRPRIPSKRNPTRLSHINLQLGNQPRNDLDQLRRRLRIRKSCRMLFPRRLEHLSSRVDEFRAVIDGRVVRGGDHDANGLAVEFLGTEDSEDSDAEEGGFEGVASEDKVSKGKGDLGMTTYFVRKPAVP